MKTYFRLATKLNSMLSLVPVLDILLPNGSRETTPCRKTTPGKRREWKDKKISTRRAIFRGKLSSLAKVGLGDCKTRPNARADPVGVLVLACHSDGRGGGGHWV